MQCMKKLSVVVAVISLSYAQAAQAGAITVYTALEEDEIDLLITPVVDKCMYFIYLLLI